MSQFTLNGRALAFDLDPETPLLWALRDAANLTGTKYGCGNGDCGACTILVDGAPTLSCQMPLARCEGREVITIEGLSRDRSHPVQQAWIAEHVTQCGFCEPGMILAIAGLLARNANPSDADIDAAVPNICRCGIYPRARKAIHRAARVMRGEETLAVAPPPAIRAKDAARQVPAIKPSK